MTEDATHAPAFAVVGDDWLSGVLDRACARLVPIPDEAEEKLKNAARAQLDRALEETAFLYAVVDADQPHLTHALEGLGFRHAETRLTLERTSGGGDPEAEAEATRDARPADEDAIAEIAARSFQHNRFHMDPRFSRDEADHVKQAWVRGFFRGTRGDAMIVAERDGAVAGFLLLIEDDEDRAIIDLMAVAPEYRGHGLGCALVATSAGRYPPNTPLRVGTQLANRPSLRLYGGCGFRVVRGAQVFHYHGGP